MLRQLEERIEEAIGASTDAGYTAALELLRKDTAPQPQKTKAPACVADFIGSSAGGYGYNYGYVY